ncbi:GntR family transcriptional regulator [Serratia fonticola]|jgi:GntR family transcriptional regulator|uniref:GntR family transcriptional regulator n=1 Tax=Serratia fonticola TaxID=47917 RepID=A0A542BUQ2_SERFO|nr:GntR family transcriptional regulator [Serratia fonticola]TQI82294.1 GntR family transcriptional regulator [Serratia fonticola]TQI95686.1 GntR family transcriptional regulator [Serratia fonticola]TVZ70182.1 GntR family transcriptional regulator [Serratia fonticola]
MNDFIAWLCQQFSQAAAAPRYIQLATTIEIAIKKHVLAVGDFLPPERMMAEALDLSRVTVSKAMKLLEEKALVSRQQGIGTRVAMHIGYSLNQDHGFTAQVLRTGSNVSNQWLLRTRMTAPADVAKALELDGNSVVVKLRRLRLMDGNPVSLETTYIPLRFLPDPETLEHSLYALWQSRGITPDGRHFLLKAVASNDEQASLLNVQRGTPLLRIVQTSRNSQGEVLELSETLCRSDVYEFEVNS